MVRSCVNYIDTNLQYFSSLIVAYSVKEKVMVTDVIEGRNYHPQSEWKQNNPSQKKFNIFENNLKLAMQGII